MQIPTTFLVFTAVIIAPLESKPIWSDLFVSTYQYPSAIIDARPQLLQYQDAYSPYYVYNVHTDLKTVPTAVIANGKPAISHSPQYNVYYGTPIYDFRFPLNPVYPVLRPSQPGLIPRPTLPPTSTAHPLDNDDDGIEKLDTKVDPEKEGKKPSENDGNDEDNDSIAIDAI